MRNKITYLFSLLLFVTACKKESIISNGKVAEAAVQQALVNPAGHFIGERFGGGVIFYLDSSGKHGLISDTIDTKTSNWWNGSLIPTGATGTAIGTGRSNTRLIISAQGFTFSYAALVCARLKRNGYNDWFLPSKDELRALYNQRQIVGGFDENYYWSSSEYSSRNAWDLDFYDGYHYRGWKANAYAVRAIRAF